MRQVPYRSRWRALYVMGVSILLFPQAESSAQSLQSRNQTATGVAAAQQAGASSLAQGAGLSPAVAAALQKQLSLQASNALIVDAMRRSQIDARNAAASNPSVNLRNPSSGAILNGIGLGALDPNVTQAQIDSGFTQSGPVAKSQVWQGGNLPVETVKDGTTTVTVKQTAANAIFSWKSFNVGKDTELLFDQGGNKAWVALNRVVDSVAPSSILGRIKADGQVLVINKNGILFGGPSQVNVKTLIASSADIQDAQFLKNGNYYSSSVTSKDGSITSTTYLPSFTGAAGAILVEKGAQITTGAPDSNSNGGFALLMGSSVTNAGTITTPKGQAELAAGDDFILRDGFGTESNRLSTTRGNEIATVIRTPGAGSVTNLGVIEAITGDITLAGRTVTQAGIALSTTSVYTRGTIHLLSSASDSLSGVTLAAGSLTEIGLDESGTAASGSQRAATIASAIDPLAFGTFDNLGTLPDRQALSRIEVVTGGVAEFQGGSVTLANGGQVAVSGARRVQLASGALIDVSGANTVLPASANTVAINIQGSELRDAPVNRDAGNLIGSNVTVDRRSLILVPKGVGGYTDRDRYYTGGGLLEAGGYLARQGHTIQEYASVGGTITLDSASVAGSVVTQSGAILNISGGSINYGAGQIAQSYLQGADGNVYNVNSAPANIRYTGLYNGFVDTRSRWKVTETFANPFFGPRAVDAYTVGRDAGSLILSTPTSIFEAQIEAGASNGAYQTVSRTNGAQPVGALADAYLLSQNTVALPGSLTLGQHFTASATVNNVAGLIDTFASARSSVLFGRDIPQLAALVGSGTAVPAARFKTAYFDADAISGFGLGGITILGNDAFTSGSLQGNGSTTVSAPLTLAQGGALTIASGLADIAAPITVRGGSVSIANGPSSITLEPGAVIDTRGVFTNASLDPETVAGEAYVNGGNVTLSSTRALILGARSLIDASAGATIFPNSTVNAKGAGGNITIAAGTIRNFDNLTSYPFLFGGEVRSRGFAKGGSLTITAPSLAIGDGIAALPGKLTLAPRFFAQGFSSYDIDGQDGVSIAPRTALTVTQPVLALTPATYAIPTGGDPSGTLDFVLPDLYVANPVKAQLTQRAGASLTLRAIVGDETSSAGGTISIGAGSTVVVDPGSAFQARAPGSIVVGDSARITASGGSINLVNTTPALGNPNGRSIWLGKDSVLDVAGRAVTALDISGNRYGIAPKGGTVSLGGSLSSGGTSATDAFIVVRPGATVDASGASVVIDIPDGTNGLIRRTTPLTVAADGGSIALSSNSGIYNEGTLRAPGGGSNASGGLLAVTLEHPVIAPRSASQTIESGYSNDRTIVIGQARFAPALPDALTPDLTKNALSVGDASFSADAIMAGGFGTVSLYAKDAIVFDGNVSLRAGRSIKLFQGPISQFGSNADVTLTAPYVQLSGYTSLGNLDAARVFPNGYAPSRQIASGTFTVDAGLIDVSNAVSFGQSKTFQDYAGFQDVVLNSTGDLRFSNSGVLAAPGNLSLIAGQIYGSSQSQIAYISAGIPVDYTNSTSPAIPNINAARPGTSLTIRRASPGTPPLPFAVLSELDFYAETINQGGVVRAPQGRLGFNAKTINLQPGSITSVGTAGLNIPFGGSIDGVTYNVNGGNDDGTSFAFSQLDTARSQLGLNAGNIAIATGATVDLAGGGAFSGAAFISGRGGSTDTLLNPLVSFNAASSTFSAPSLAANPVYAIVAGPQPAAATASPYAKYAGSNPGIGDQVKIADGAIPGLPAGFYTLLPSIYALLPGAFRVEIGTVTTVPVATVQRLDGSYTTAGYKSVADSSIVASLPSVLTVTPGATVRTYSQYREQTLDDFALANAKTLSLPRPALVADAKALALAFAARSPGAPAFSNLGSVLTKAGDGGYGAQVMVSASARGSGVSAEQQLEIVASKPTAGFAGISLGASDLNALNADVLTVQTSSYIDGLGNKYIGSIDVQDGTVLSAPSLVFSATPYAGGLISSSVRFEAGSVVSTLGFAPRTGTNADGTARGNDISVAAGSITIPDGAGLFSAGALSFNATVALNLSANVRYGAKSLAVSSTNINIGSDAALAAASLPEGLNLNAAAFARLLTGANAAGAPKLQTLSLTASNAVNFLGTVDLTSIDPVTGVSSLAEFDINAPGIYGFGAVTDRATLTTGKFVWNGALNSTKRDLNGYIAAVSAAEPAVIARGPGSGSGVLSVIADRIVFGYPDLTFAQRTTPLDRTALGFSAVNLTAKTSVSANSNGTLSVFQSKVYDAASNTFKKTGGKLNIATPLLTADNGAILKVNTGGALTLANPIGGPANSAAIKTLGAEIDLAANAIALDTAVALPSGVLSLVSSGDISLGNAARIDLSGRSTDLFSFVQNSPGGIASFESATGNIALADGSVIDVSAVKAKGGRASFTATAPGKGIVALDGTLRGSGGAGYNGGAFDVRAETFGNFAALNAKLNAGGFFASRSFDVKQGDLVIGGGVKASTVSVSVDGGKLDVTGLIDASGANPGTIRLASRDALTLASSAVLDARGTVLHTDGNGNSIDADNTAKVELTSAAGLLTLAAGSTIDLRSPDGITRGEIGLNASRNGGGDGATIAASGPFAILGAKSIALNGFAQFAPAKNPSFDPATGKQNVDQATGLPIFTYSIDQALFDATVDPSSKAFIAAAAGNGTFQNAIAGLKAYSGAFHLRPGVEIDSPGDLTVFGDLDLSAFRYGPGANAATGAGEPGTLVLRAAGNLNITGTINDGFNTTNIAPSQTWSLAVIRDTGGRALPLNQDAVVGSAGVTLTAGTLFAPGTVLSFALPIKGSVSKITSVNYSNGNQTNGVTLPFDYYADTGNLNVTFTAMLIGAYNYVLKANYASPFSIEIDSPKGLLITGGDFYLRPEDLIANAKVLRSSGFGPYKNSGIYKGILKGDTKTTQFGLSSVSDNISPVNVGFDGSVDDNGGLVPEGTTLLPTSVRGYSGQATNQFSRAVDSIGFAAGVVFPMDVTLASGTDRFFGANLAYYQTGNYSKSDVNIVNSPTGGATIFPKGTFLGPLRNDQQGTQSFFLGSQEISAQTDPRANYGSDLVITDTQRTLSAAIASGTVLPRAITTLDALTIPQSFVATGRIVNGSDTYQPGTYIKAGLNLVAGAELDAGVTLPTPSGNQSWLFSNDIVWPAGLPLTFAKNVVSSSTDNFYAIKDLPPLSNAVPLRAGTSIPAGIILDTPIVLRTGAKDYSTALAQAPGSQSWSYRIASGADIGAADPLIVTAKSALNGGGNATLSDPHGPANVAPSYIRTGSGSIDIAAGGNLTLDSPFTISNSGVSSDISTVAQGSIGNVGQLAVVGSGGGAVTIKSGGDARTIASAAGSLGIEARGNLYARTFAGGQIAIEAGSIGAVGRPLDPRTPGYGQLNPVTGVDLRIIGTDPGGISAGGSNAVASVVTRRDLVLQTIGGAIDAVSLGGDVSTPVGTSAPGDSFVPQLYAASNVSAVATTGNLVVNGSLELAPSATGQLRLIAGNTLFGNGLYTVDISGADAATFVADPTGLAKDTPTFNLHANDPNPVQIFAVNGDILNLKFGETRIPGGSKTYVAAKPAEIRAGRDIYRLTSLILNNRATDVSTVSAGRDIFYANVQIAGPGTLTVQAGRNVYQGGQGQLESIGGLFDVNTSNRNNGASIAVLAGVGAAAPDYRDFAKVYLDPVNLANPALGLSNQPGKAAKNYDADLADWLTAKYGYQGGLAGAYAYFQALPAEQQAVFLRQIYFAELKAGGREYNDPQSIRYKSYARSRAAIASLFPDPAGYDGALTMFSDRVTSVVQGGTNGQTMTVTRSSFIRTDFGGDIQTLTPGGQTLIGVEGITPGANTGLLTQGMGDIDIFSRDSILLGLSRVSTTSGGSILAYSENGDINAGRGSKTTEVFSPPRFVYDIHGNITFSPAVPTSGAGFATLNPIPEILPGDIDLIAPLGSVDAGEAGIRVSGNINIAALQVLNANNIDVQGKSSGLPVFETANTGALTNASNTSAAATNTNAAPARASARASIIIVEIIGFGGDDTPSGDCPGGVKKVDGKCPVKNPAPGAGGQAAIEGPDPDSAIQILGEGRLSAQALRSLTPEQQRFLVE